MYWQTQDILIFFPKVILQTPFAFIILFNILGHLTTVDYLIMHSVGSQLGLCIIRSYALSDVSHLWLSVTSSCSLHLSYGFSVKIGSQFIYYIVIMLLEPSE